MAGAAIASVEAWSLIAAVARPADLARAAMACRDLAVAIRGARELNAAWDVRARHLWVVPAASVVRLRVWQVPRARLCVLSDELPVASVLPPGAKVLPAKGCPRLAVLDVHAVRAAPGAWAAALETCPALREVRVAVERDSLAGLDRLVALGAPRLERLVVTAHGARRVEHMAGMIPRDAPRPAWAPAVGFVESDTLREYDNDVHAICIDAPLRRLRVRDFDSTPCLAGMRGRTLGATELEWSAPWARLPAAFAFAACESLALDVRGVWSLAALDQTLGWLADLKTRMPGLRRLRVRVELAPLDRAAREVRVPRGAFAGVAEVRLAATFPPLGFVRSLGASGAGALTVRFDEPLTADLRRDLDDLVREGADSEDEDVLQLLARIDELELLA